MLLLAEDGLACADLAVGEFAVLAEVQASNLSKLMPDGSVKLREDGKVLKGPNFFPPNVARGLGIDE